MKVNSKNKMKSWKRSQIQVFFIKRNVFCLSLLVTIPKRDRVHGWQSLQPGYWLVPSLVSGHGTVAGDYYGIWCEGNDGKVNGGDSPLSSFPSSLALLLIALLSLIGTLRSDDGDCIENVKTSNRFSKQKNNFARVSRFFVHCLVITARLQRGNNFPFYGGGKQATKKFTFSFWTWIRLLGEFLYIRKNKWFGIIEMKIEEASWKRESSARRATGKPNAIKMHLSPKARGWSLSVA